MSSGQNFPNNVKNVGVYSEGGTISIAYQQVGDVTINVPRKSELIPSDVRPGSSNFVGRAQELDDLDALLQQEGMVALCAVRGMGGVGKTELAIQYALSEVFQQHYAACYWFSLNERDLATQVLLKARPYLAMPEAIEKSTDVAEQVKWCWQNWYPTEGDVLVILDDVQDLADIPRWAMPIDPRFKVMLTTRCKNLSPRFRELLLGVLSEGEAIELLEKIVGYDRIQEDLDTARQICRRLEYLPLALELAATYLVEDELLSLGEYLERLNLMDESLSDQMVDRIQAERGVVAAFDLSWQRLQGLSSRLAMVLGRFAPDEIPWQGLVQPVVESLGWEAKAARKGRVQLSNLHLITITQQKTIKLHSLLREYFRFQGVLVGDEFIHGVEGAIANQTVEIAKTIPQTPVKTHIEHFRPFIPHLEETAVDMFDSIANPEENLVWGFEGIARFYYGQGLYQAAAFHRQKRLEVLQERLSKDHPDVAISFNDLAEVYRIQGRYTEAEPLYLRSLDTNRSIHGENHPEVATSLNNLAVLYYSQGHYTQAEPLFLQSLKIRETQLGAYHPHVAQSLNNLAEVYTSQGHYTEAEPLYLRSLQLRKTQLGTNYLDIARSLNSLAGFYQIQGRYTEAEPLYVQSLQIRETQLGVNHPDVAVSLNNLALLYKSQGRYTEAEPLYVRSLQIRETQLGANHPDVAVSLNNLALLYQSQGCYTKSELPYAQSLQIWTTQLGLYHPHVASSLNNLATLYKFQGRYTEAELLYGRAVQILEKHLAQDHPDIATILNNLAVLYQSQGCHNEALPLFQRAFAISENSLGNHHPATQRIRKNLASRRLAWWEWTLVLILALMLFPFKLLFTLLRWLCRRILPAGP
jgi:tetratricopeptide (TPR) repeat protein